MSNLPLLQATGIKKSYRMGRTLLEVLKGIDLTVFEGEALAIVGASGAGKSTLLHILGTLDRPTSGQVLFSGKNLFLESDETLARFRNTTIGFTFQFHHLLAEFSALENVMMPARIAGLSPPDCRRSAEQILTKLGLGGRLNHFPSELSGGEQQRVAIARALVRSPRVLLADEPTGNLDQANGRQIQDLFFQLKEDLGITLIVVTHDSNFASRFPRTLTIVDGRWT